VSALCAEAGISGVRRYYSRFFYGLEMDCTYSEQEHSQESTYFYEFDWFLAYMAYVYNSTVMDHLSDFIINNVFSVFSSSRFVGIKKMNFKLA